MGLRPNEFWDLTAAEFFIMVKGYQKRQKDRRNEIITNAWITANLSLVKKMPKLDSLLIKDEADKKTKQQTTSEMIATCKLLNSSLGGKEERR